MVDTATTIAVAVTDHFKIPPPYVRVVRLATFAFIVITLALYGLAFLPRLYFLLLSLPPGSGPSVLIALLGEYIIVVAGAIIGLFLFFRSGSDFVTIMTVLGVIVCFGNTTALSFYPALLHPALKIPGSLAYLAMTPISYGWLLTFPDGRVVYPRVLWMIVPSFFWDIWRLTWLYPTEINAMLETAILRAAFGGVAVLLLIPGVISQFYRYRYQATLIQRQQTKWVVLALLIGVFGVVGASLLRAVTQAIGSPDAALAGELVASVMTSLALVAMMFILMFAVTRRGLWDVDLTLNRSLVIAAVTLLLGAIFAAIFITAQAVLRLVLAAGQGEIAVAMAALAVGLLFNPVRIQVRRFVDRRLYGLRFDLNQLQRGQRDHVLNSPGALTGQILDGYNVMGVIGRGAMGEVYRAQKEGGQQVALKILRPELVADTQTRLRFEREGAIMLNHPGIVQTYHYGQADGIYYIVMEYVEGQNLRDVLHERGRLPLPEILPFIHPFAAALDIAHASGYIHRDIKPSNIILRPITSTKSGKGAPIQFEAVLMDFGIARVVDETSQLTGSGAVGTIDYMAPEQIVTSRTVDGRADIYALGVLMYEALTGERPFKGNSAQIMFGHLQQPPPDPRDLLDTIPDHAALAVMRAMSKSPDDRFTTAEAFAAALA